MKLREVDIDAPELPRETRSSFRYSVRSLAALFQRAVVAAGQDARGSKLIVDFLAQPKRRDVTLSLGVYAVQAHFDFDAYASAGQRERNHAVLDALARGFAHAATLEGWNPELCSAAKQHVLEHDFENKWSFGKPIASPGRKYRAELACEHGSAEFRAELIVSTQGGDELLRVPALHTLPDELNFRPSLGKLEWTSATRVRLCAKDGKEVAYVDVAEHMA